MLVSRVNFSYSVTHYCHISLARLDFVFVFRDRYISLYSAYKSKESLGASVAKEMCFQRSSERIEGKSRPPQCGWKVITQLRTGCRETPVAKFVVCSWHEQLPDVVGRRPQQFLELNDVSNNIIASSSPTQTHVARTQLKHYYYVQVFAETTRPTVFLVVKIISSFFISRNVEIKWVIMCYLMSHFTIHILYNAAAAAGSQFHYEHCPS